ncbi:MAG: aspartate/tyrosine/aromatic aminotransferase [Kordiimonadaceae bacterium]|nr:aspartate/tyrosine/aromatic aminotransferase [Kordiimonadaceae bacterium]
MLFNGLSEVGDDPILLVSTMFKASKDPNKVDLGVGVYKDAQGHTAILNSVKKAEQFLVENQETKTYLSPAGNPEFNALAQNMMLGEDHAAVKENRVSTFQTPGGTGGIRIGLEFVKACNANANIWISDPTWPNHTAITKALDLNPKQYRYYDIKRGEFLYQEMLEDLSAAQAGDVVILHGCCHNASGADLSHAQWNELADLMLDKGLVPFVDFAYQGFANGIEEDSYSARLIAKKLPEALIASSCSKNFAMYRDRAGAITLISPSADVHGTNKSHMLKAVRANYSMPPDHGAAVAAHILGNPDLKAEWMTEVDEMRNRVKKMRALFVEKMDKKAPNSGFGYIKEQNGMFSYLTLSAEQIQTLINDHSIFFMANGRVNMAGLTEANIDYVTDAIASLFKS